MTAHADLLAHLPGDGRGQASRPARRSRRAPTSRCRESLAAGEQEPVVGVDDGHDDRHVGARVVLAAVGRAPADPAREGRLGRGAAPRAVAVGAVPVREGEGRHERMRPEVVEHGADLPQRAPRLVVRHGCREVVGDDPDERVSPGIPEVERETGEVCVDRSGEHEGRRAVDLLDGGTIADEPDDAGGLVAEQPGQQLGVAAPLAATVEDGPAQGEVGQDCVGSGHASQPMGGGRHTVGPWTAAPPFSPPSPARRSPGSTR